MKTQLTGIEAKVDKAQAHQEVMNGSVAMVIDKAEKVDARVAALENVERGKAIAREEMTAAVALAKKETIL